MIAREMSKEEVLRELQEDDYFVLGRIEGLNIKNKKKLQSKFIKHNEIMSRSTYTIPGTNDAAVAYAIKFVQILRGKEYASMVLLYYIKTSYGTYIIPSRNDSTCKIEAYIEFSVHAEDRLKERLGKDFDTFFQEDIRKNNGLIQPVKYNYNSNENEYAAHVGDAFLIMEGESPLRRCVVKTVLGRDNLHVNQLQLNLESKIAGENSVKESYNELDAAALAHLKSFKRAGCLRAIA